MKSFRGRKSLGGSTARSPTRLDDTLFGTDTVEVILAVSEGPCQGLVGGASGFLVADVPLVDPGTTTPNVSNFELRVLKGTTPADSILPNLGGIGSSHTIGLDLRTQLQQVVGAGQNTQIDYIDLRFTVGRLFATNDRGDELATGLAMKIEIKPRSSSTWQIPFTNEPPPTEQNTAGASNYRPNAQRPGSHVNAAYHETYIQSTEPSAATANPGAMWFNTSTANWPPKERNTTGAWVVPNSLAGAAVADSFYLWTWIDVFGQPRAAWYDQSGQSRSPAADRIAIDDFLLVPSASQDVYAWNGLNWNATDDQFTAPTPAEPGRFDIYGVTRSTYPYEVRIPVARINEPYDIRVTRLSEKETKYFLAQINWESFQEISRDVYSFPGLALSHLTIKATDTFTSLPEFTQIWDGRIIRVPSNYDPVSRLYVGFWDGTFKLAYSNNPAWVAYDLVMNTSYGKNRYFPEVLDPLATYEFGKHCDAHKFTMNEYITDPRSISETVNYIVGTAGGRYVDRGDGYSTILFDADDQPAVAVFAQENVVDGLFNYSFTDITARKNDYRVSFVNPLIGWVEDRVRVYDQNSIDVQGTNPEEFIAVGCTDGEEAVRRGRLRLATALTEKTICSFKTNRQGRFLQPFQIVLLADPDAQQVISGRIASVVNSTTLLLRDEVYLEAAIPLTITFTVGDGNGGFRNASYQLSNPSGGRTKTLTLTSPLNVTLPEKAVFAIGTPKAYRITSIEESEDPDNISITVIEINRLKWAFVDGLVELDDIIALQSGPLSRYTYPPTDLRVSAVTRADGTVTGVLSWVQSPSQTGGYRVYSSFEGKRSELIAEPGNGTQVEIPNLQAGVYVFTVTALSYDQAAESAPASIRFILQSADGFRPVINAAGLRLVDEPQSPIFRRVNAVFTWDNTTEPLFDKYRVDVLATNGAQYRTEVVDTPGYTYSLVTNRADNNGTPVRNFTLQLRTRDTQGNLSSPSALAVSHPPPAVIVPNLSANSENAIIQFPQPVETDWRGTLIWMSETSGFNPLTTTPLDVGTNLVNFLKGTPGKTYYIRLAAYDSYSKTGLNISPEYSVTITILLFDPLPPNIPGTVTLTTAAELSPDGTAAAVVNATWTQDTNTNFGKYEVAFAESLPGTAEQSKNYVVDVVNASAWERHGFIPGRLVSVKVRALSKNGFAASGYSTVATMLAALNTTPPANPTGFTATGGFERAYLSWTPATNRDLDYVEVWAFNGSSGATSPPGGSTLIGTVAYGTNFFSDNQIATTGTRTYWLRSVNTSGAKPTTYTGPAGATSAALQQAQLAAGIIDATRLAVNLKAVEILSALPTTGNTEGRSVYVNGRLNTWSASTSTNGGWTAPGDTALAGGIIGQITETQITPNSISTATLNTNQIFANTAVLSSITAGVLTAGAIKAGMIAAGAITADQIGVGLNTGNLFWNSDFLAQPHAAPPFGHTYATTANFGTPNFTIYNDTASNSWNPVGMASMLLNFSGTVATNQYADITLRRPTQDNSYSARWPVVANKYYEMSAYASVHRCNAYCYVTFYDASGNSIVSYLGSTMPGSAASGPLAAFPRSTLKVQAPSNAATVGLTLRMAGTGESNCFTFWSGVYFANAQPNQLTFSDWTPASNTVINGGQISTNSLNANRIVAGSITTDRLAAGQIDVSVLNAETLRARIVATDGLTANNIIVGTARLNSWVSGSDTTKINGGVLSNNSITTNQLKVGSRNLQLVNVSFYAKRDANGARTNIFGWTGGSLITLDDNGSAASTTIPASEVTIDGGYWYIWWGRGATNLGYSKDNWSNIYTNPDVILIATVSDMTGISVLVGGTIIDGTRIVTRSIQADQIAANAIQAIHIAANSINGDRITAGTLSASKISAGAIAVNTTITMGTQFYIENNATGPRIRITNNENNQNRIVLGELSNFTQGGDYGLMCYDGGGVLRFQCSSTGTFIDGGIISNATIVNAKIVDSTIGYRKVGDNALSQTVAASSNGLTATVGVQSRGSSSRFQICAFRRGNQGTRFGVGVDTGTLYIQYSTDNSNFTNLDGISGAVAYQYDKGVQANYSVLQSTTLYTIWAPAYTGVLYFRVVDTNNAGQGGVYIAVTELGK